MDDLFCLLAMSLINFLFTASWIADYALLPPMISLGMDWEYSIEGISLVLKIILLMLLKSASNNKIALNLSTLTTPGFFSNITDIPFV